MNEASWVRSSLQQEVVDSCYFHGFSRCLDVFVLEVQWAVESKATCSGAVSLCRLGKAGYGI